MRIGTFLLGGLVGACAAVYLSNRAKPMLWSAIANSTGLGNVMNQARSKMGQAASGFTGSQAASPASGSKPAPGSEQQQAGGLDKVQSMVNQDPQVKAQVNEILNAGGADTEGGRLQ